MGATSLLLFPAFFGWAGVAVFFAVSGFCIHLSHQRSRSKGYQVYFLRRFFRIYPPYFLALLIFECLLRFPSTWLGKDHDFAHLIDSVGDLLTHLFLVHNFSKTYFFGTINGVFWSVAVEAQLYALYPLLLWLTLRLGWRRTLWLTALVEIGLRSFDALSVVSNSPHSLPQVLSGSPLYFWFSWTIGAALADAWLKAGPLPFRQAWGWLWPVLFLASYFFKPSYPYAFTLAALSSTYLMSWCLSRPNHAWTVNGWLKVPLEHLRWAGMVSYSAYLLHQPILNTVPRIISIIFHHHPIPTLVMYGFCLLAWFPIFGLSYLFYRYVEQPSIAWGKTVIARTQHTNSPLDPTLSAIPSP